MYNVVISVDIRMVFIGILCLLIDVSVFGVLFCCVRLNSIWLL